MQLWVTCIIKSLYALVELGPLQSGFCRPLLEVSLGLASSGERPWNSLFPVILQLVWEGSTLFGS